MAMARGYLRGLALGLSRRVNFARDVVEAAPRARAGAASSSRATARGASGPSARSRPRPRGAVAAHLAGSGLRRGDVVLTLVGNRPEWVLTMVACFRLGLVALPCTEQLRAKDLELRLRGGAARGSWSATSATPTCWRPPAGTGRRCGRRGALPGDAAAPARGRARAGRSVPDHVHVRHRRRAQGRPARPALPVRPDAAGAALARRPRRATSCGARPRRGWSKSARNAFIAPWLRGAAALLHDARFDPHERLELLDRERVDVLCMAPTEYRVIAKRATLRRADRPARARSPPARR